MHHKDNQGNIHKLYKIIKDIRIAMMTTLDEKGQMTSRPMYNQEADENGHLWFYTETHSPKIKEINQDSKLNLTFSNPAKNYYVTMSGQAETIHDRELIKTFWTEGLRVWFPKGPDDPEIALICFKPEQAEFWDSPSSTLLHLYGYIKARTIGAPPYELSENEKIELNQ